MHPNNTFSDRLKNLTELLSNRWVIAIIIILSILFGFIFILLFNLNSEVTILPAPKEATIFYDINRKEYTRIFEENRLEVPLHKIPNSLKKAVVNVEDARFYEHSGFDLRAIFRALWVDIKGRSYIEGASTITQQLARNVMLSQKKRLTRKIQEIFLAMKIERSYTKDEILERYLNQIYLGHGAYGVEAASIMYFGKSVSELDLHQVALLIGLAQSPNRYSPFTNPEAALKRRSIVLSQMVKYGSITPKQGEIYNQKPLDTIPQAVNKRKAAYFIDYIIQNIGGTIDEEALYTGGYKIYTTLDPLAQEAADEAIATLTGGEPDAQGVLQPQLALVAIDPRNGYIKAMIGGRDFGSTQLNRAVSANRQPGSTIKPFVYTAAIDSRLYTPGSIVTDEEVAYPLPDGSEWKPRNFSRFFRGDISIREALEASVNIIAVKLVDELGASKIISYARKMGLKNLVVNGEINDLNLGAMALGGLVKGVTPLELTTAYTPLANQGITVEPIAVLEVVDDNDNTIYEGHPKKKVAISPDTAYLVTDMLRGVMMRGTGRSAALDRPAAGKTGTTNDNTNAWFVGYTPDLLATVWIGNDSQNKPITIDGVSIGSGRAARIWGAFMRKALSKTPPSDFPQPDGIVTGIEICAKTGMLTGPDCTEIKYESYLAGTEPIDICNGHDLFFDPDILNEDPITFPTIPSTDSEPSSTLPTDQVTVPNPGTVPVPSTTTVPDQTGTKKKKKVMVKICAESGLLANTNCPEELTVTEIFTEGEDPKSYCNVHN